MKTGKQEVRHLGALLNFGNWRFSGVDRRNSGWQRVGRVRVQVRAKIVWRHSPSERIGDGQHHIGGRNFHLCLVEPAPNGDLTDLGVGDALADTARQLRLPTGKLDSFGKGFF